MKIKKEFVTPELVVYGDIEDLTLQNGTGCVDVPFGTSSGVPGGITSNNCGS